MMHILTQLYPIRKPERLCEIKFCFEKNFANPKISEIHVLLDEFTDEIRESEKYEFLKHPKIKWKYVDKRPTYQMFFEYANVLLEDRWCSITNSDVYFDETVGLFHEMNFDNRLACITRYNIGHDENDLTLQGDGGSHDAWVFCPKIKSFRTDIVLGVLGCDSYLAQRARESGIYVFNPCKTVILRHLHRDEERNNTPNGLSYWGASDYKGERVDFCALDKREM